MYSRAYCNSTLHTRILSILTCSLNVRRRCGWFWFLFFAKKLVFNNIVQVLLSSFWFIELGIVWKSWFLSILYSFSATSLDWIWWSKRFILKPCMWVLIISWIKAFRWTFWRLIAIRVGWNLRWTYWLYCMNLTIFISLFFKCIPKYVSIIIICRTYWLWINFRWPRMNITKFIFI